MGKLYKENWYKKWQKEAIMGKFPRVYRYSTGLYRYSPPEANLYRYRSNLYWYRPTECNLYRYRSKVYRYRCAQIAQIV